MFVFVCLRSTVHPYPRKILDSPMLSRRNRRLRVTMTTFLSNIRALRDPGYPMLLPTSLPDLWLLDFTVISAPFESRCFISLPFIIISCSSDSNTRGCAQYCRPHIAAPDAFCPPVSAVCRLIVQCTQITVAPRRYIVHIPRVLPRPLISFMTPDSQSSNRVH